MKRSLPWWRVFSWCTPFKFFILLCVCVVSSWGSTEPAAAAKHSNGSDEWVQRRREAIDPYEEELDRGHKRKVKAKREIEEVSAEADASEPLSSLNKKKRGLGNVFQARQNVANKRKKLGKSWFCARLWIMIMYDWSNLYDLLATSGTPQSSSAWHPKIHSAHVQFIVHLWRPYLTWCCRRSGFWHKNHNIHPRLRNSVGALVALLWKHWCVRNLFDVLSERKKLKAMLFRSSNMDSRGLGRRRWKKKISFVSWPWQIARVESRMRDAKQDIHFE